MKKLVAEFIGTFTLVLVGCGTAVIAGADVGLLGISFAFGLALIAMAYSIGNISGCHINPAVSLAVFVSGRMRADEALGYIVAQCAGGIAGAAVLLTLLSGGINGYELAVTGLGQNGWGAGYLGEYGQSAAMLFEFVATLLFVVVILMSTQHKAAPKGMAGLAIGLTLVAIHILGINITGVSVNPARSLGPALLVGGQAMEQLWLFLVAPAGGAILGGLVSRYLVSEAPETEASLTEAKAQA
ncbi:MAG: aquaporin [Vampirovibrio sp.]|nr:aquaporin [Vampirovibrio sp.]